MKKSYVAMIVGISVILFSVNLYAQDNDSQPDMLRLLETRMAQLYASAAQSVVRIILYPHNNHGGDYVKTAPVAMDDRIATGFMVNSDGYIVTTAEISAQTGAVAVRTGDDRQYTAEVIAVDEKLDISLLKIDKAGLPALKLGSACSTKPGHLVMSISNPYGLTNSMSWGFVNSRRRTGLRPGCVENYIQTTLPMNPGDSGSPLINTSGEVIGIMIAALVDDFPLHKQFDTPIQAQGISFALPIDLIKKHIPYMIQHGKAKHSWLGIEIKNATQNDLQRLLADDNSSVYGIVITHVFPDSPAAKAGLIEDDLVTAVGDTEITKVSDLQFLISTFPVDSEIQISIIRNSKPATVTVTTGEMPENILNDN